MARLSKAPKKTFKRDLKEREEGVIYGFEPGKLGTNETDNIPVIGQDFEPESIHTDNARWFDLIIADVESVRGLEPSSLEIIDDSPLRRLLYQLRREGKFERVAFIGNAREVYNTEYMSASDLSEEEVPLQRKLVIYFPDYNIYWLKLSYVGGEAGLREDDYVLYSSTHDITRASIESERLSNSNTGRDVTYLKDTNNGTSNTTQTISEDAKPKSLVLNDKVREMIFDNIQTFFGTESTFFEKYDVPKKRGILLYGKPGNGKTTIIKSLIHSMEIPFVVWSVTEFTNSDSIDYVFKDQLSRFSSVVLVIEDMDSLSNKQSRSTLLNHLDGINSAEGVFIIGTTNYPEHVDSALKNRPGRFDKTIEIPLPDKDLRTEYMFSRGGEDFLTEEDRIYIVKQTEGFSFVHLNEIFITLAMQFHNGHEKDIDYPISIIKENIKNEKSDEYFQEDKSKKVGFQ